ncbi:hypothetical protein Moror_11796 [Moniliophthora roreri MCA 2997]|nr:hypothetical protein Moror_11796 [Moniliophthora roreri MCA 2997]
MIEPQGLAFKNSIKATGTDYSQNKDQTGKIELVGVKIWMGSRKVQDARKLSSMLTTPFDILFEMLLPPIYVASRTHGGYDTPGNATRTCLDCFEEGI